MIEQGFLNCNSEHGIHTRASYTGDLLIVCLYVDDLLITGSTEEGIYDFKGNMMVEFEIFDLGKVTYFLGMELVPSSKGTSCTRRNMKRHYKEIQHAELESINNSY